MMNTLGQGYGLPLFYYFHVLSIVVFGFGVALLLIWAFKHLAEKALWKGGWLLLVIGTIACLLTLPAWPYFLAGTFGQTGYGAAWTGSPGMMRMMWGGAWGNQAASDTSGDEAKGRDIYGKLQAKQLACSDLSDDDFDLLGDYFMGLQWGGGHGQMDLMMQQMMGDAAEKQMHIIMGRRLSGCGGGDAASLQFPQGMMRGLFNPSSPQ